jgi:hypothetical protein
MTQLLRLQRPPRRRLAWSPKGYVLSGRRSNCCGFEHCQYLGFGDRHWIQLHTPKTSFTRHWKQIVENRRDGRVLSIVMSDIRFRHLHYVSKKVHVVMRMPPLLTGLHNLKWTVETPWSPILDATSFKGHRRTLGTGSIKGNPRRPWNGRRGCG